MCTINTISKATLPNPFDDAADHANPPATIATDRRSGQLARSALYAGKAFPLKDADAAGW